MDPQINQPAARSWHRRLLQVLLSLMVLVIAIFLIWRINLSSTIKARLKALQQAGHPISLAGLEQLRYPPIAPETNAATFFNEIIARNHFTNALSQELFSEIRPHRRFPENSVLFSTEYREKIGRLLTENQEVLDLLHKSPPGPVGRYHLDFTLGYKMPLPHLMPLSRSVELLTIQAVTHADQNQMAAALDDLQAALRIIDSLADEPILISHLTRFRCQRSIHSGLERILGRRSFTESQLLVLSAAFRNREHPQAITYAMEGETCFGMQFFQRSPQESATLADLPDANQNSFDENKHSPAGFALLNWSGFTPRDFNYFLGIMAEQLAATKLPFPERIKAGLELAQRVDKEAHRNVYIYSGLLIPALASSCLAEADALANLNIIQTALAIERYRLSHQDTWPERLEELVPGILSSLPADPYTGANLHYKKSASGYMIYSVGRDQKDDGGSNKTTTKGGRPEDITFEVER